MLYNNSKQTAARRNTRRCGIDAVFGGRENYLEPNHNVLTYYTDDDPTSDTH